ncbi:YfaP family protein [Tahibacter amnicola]|uniref:DUF2135 domain-containing protein n=1 Tax=Tahibacter amnicola TaxID=2976241 RepID=A0ABY6BI94_9GAMM|nr:DUF2135 domain-containing protein [Tahibacter amnicola]UXI67587.1 DUF2135 domain-containing protein [Tahibacter amnicola]
MGRSRGVLIGLAGVLASSAAGAADDASIRFDAPQAGWRNSTLDNATQTFQQSVHYPASDVNTPEGQSRFALIAGSVKANAKDAGGGPASGPYTLVVNGVPMPIRIDDAGNFSRPYSFGPGSNNVEIASPDGAERSRVQFYEAQDNKIPAKVRVVLSWDSDNSDLDLHVLTPDGQHCWYGERVIPNGGALDVDVTDGYGPEIFATPAITPGMYYVYVNYYGGSGTDSPGSPATITVATVTMITDENTIHEKRQSFVVPMRREGEITLVGSFVYAAR